MYIAAKCRRWFTPTSQAPVHEIPHAQAFLHSRKTMLFGVREDLVLEDRAVCVCVTTIFVLLYLIFLGSQDGVVSQSVSIHG